jgi:hypothetical protein
MTFEELWNSFPSEVIKHINFKTNKETFSNHCAINLSEALRRCKVSFSSFKGKKCYSCSIKNGSHALVAQELATWLSLKPFPGVMTTLKSTGPEFKKQFKGKQGIIFFKDYWQREKETGKTRTGDHIDLWRDGTLAGSGAVGSFFRVGLGVHWDGWFSDFALSKQVLLWQVP